jgi:predicted O-methyltransferase YrrM
MATEHQPLPIVPQLTDDALDAYSLRLLRMRTPQQPVDSVLREMESLAAQENVPIIGPLEGAIIQMLVSLREQPPRLVLDIGSAIGYSAIWLARGLPAESRVLSVEIDPQRVALARDFVRRADLKAQVEIIEGDVFDILPALDLQFDVILQDVIKHVYFGADSRLSLRLLDLCLEHLVEGGMLLGDNVFCMGEILNRDRDDLPQQVVGIQAYNERVATHPLLESVTFPVRDGLWVSVKRTRGNHHER